MISLTETTITVTAFVFITILVILTKLSRQLDDISNLLKHLIHKISEHNEITKWNSDSFKLRLDKIEKKLSEENNQEDFWGKGK